MKWLVDDDAVRRAAHDERHGLRQQQRVHGLGRRRHDKPEACRRARHVGHHRLNAHEIADEAPGRNDGRIRRRVAVEPRHCLQPQRGCRSHAEGRAVPLVWFHPRHVLPADVHIHPALSRALVHHHGRVRQSVSWCLRPRAGAGHGRQRRAFTQQDRQRCIGRRGRGMSRRPQAYSMHCPASTLRSACAAPAAPSAAYLLRKIPQQLHRRCFHTPVRFYAQWYKTTRPALCTRPVLVHLLFVPPCRSGARRLGRGAHTPIVTGSLPAANGAFDHTLMSMTLASCP